MRRAEVVANLLLRGGARAVRKTELVYEGRSAHLAAAAIFLEARAIPQTTIKHEFGHMLGVGDEYVEVNERRHIDRPRGAETGHSGLVAARLPAEAPVRAADDDRLMSTGDVVWPHHYVTFVDALVQMTHVREWGLQHAERPRSGPGDFPRGQRTGDDA